MLQKYGDLIAGAVTSVFAILLYIATFYIRQFNFSGLGAEFMPRIVAVIMLVLGAALSVRGALDIRARKKAQAAEESKEKAEQVKPSYFSVLATVALLLLYALLISELGFIIVTVVYLFLQILVLTPKDKIHWVRFAIISVLSTAAIYCIFTFAFKIMLPGGILG